MKRNAETTLVILYTVAMLSACSHTNKMQQNDTITDSVGSEKTTTFEETAASAVLEYTEVNEATFYGTWAIKDCQSAAVAALSSDEIAAFLNYTLTYQSDAIFQMDQKIDVAEFSYETEPYTEDLIVQNYCANLGEWWNAISEVSCVSVIASESFFGDQFFVVNDEILWIYYEGVFFLARRE